MDVQTLLVPYDSARRGVRMGQGPLYFEQHGLAQMLTSAGHHVQVQTIEAQAPMLREISTAFELHRLIAAQVSTAVSQGHFPLLVAGNCNTSVGAITGVDPRELGVIWFDAHGDFNTPETTEGGFLDGMALAIAAGRCWRALTARIPNFAPITEANIVHIGGRDLDREEADLMESSEMTLIHADKIHQVGVESAVAAAFDQLHRRVQRVYIHLDLDVLDIPVNEFFTPGGLSVEQVRAVLREAGRRFQIKGATFSAYDPAYDRDHRTLDAGFELLKTLLASAS